MNDSLIQQLLLQLVLILLNAFFASTEIAVLSLNENKVRKLAESGDKKAVRMMKMVENPTNFLSTIQIGITLAGFLGSAFAAENFSERFVNWLIHTCHITFLPETTLNTIAVVLISLILSYFTLIFGELVPKRIAMRKADELARAVSGVIQFLSLLLRPVNWLMTNSANAVLYLFRINPKETEEAVSEDDIRMMIDIGEEKGTIEPEAKEMIDNVFEFNETTVEDIMVHRTAMTVLWADSTPDEIMKTITESGFSRIPVCNEDIDDIIGILHTRDYLLAACHNPEKKLSDLIIPATFVPATIRASLLFRDMQKNKCHIAIAVDEYGGTAGLITMEDILEEIVGNIYDEYDKQQLPEISPIGENIWRISGNAPIEDVEEALDVTLHHEDDEAEYSTFGGLIIDQLAAIPPDGTHPELDIGRLHVSVELIEDHHIEWAAVKKITLPTETDEAQEKH